MNGQSNIERNVMRRVQRIRVLRAVFSGATASGVLLLAALYGIGREVWVAYVFQNMPEAGNIAALSRFWLAAFANTDLVVQVLSLIAVASVIYLARRTARALAEVLIPARV